MSPAKWVLVAWFAFAAVSSVARVGKPRPVPDVRTQAMAAAITVVVAVGFIALVVIA